MYRSYRGYGALPGFDAAAQAAIDAAASYNPIYVTDPTIVTPTPAPPDGPAVPFTNGSGPIPFPPSPEGSVGSKAWLIPAALVSGAIVLFFLLRKR